MEVIRLLAPEDAEELTASLVENRASFEDVMPDRPDGYYTVEYQRDRLLRVSEQTNEHEGWLFAILDGGKIVGTLNMGDVIRGPVQLANIGYWVDHRLYGRGLATRAVADVLEYAFGELGLHRLEAGTLPDNIASQRVLEKNGFTRYGLARGLVLIGGAWRDHALFERLADD